MHTPRRSIQPEPFTNRIHRRSRCLTAGVALLLVSGVGHGMEWPIPDVLQQRIDDGLAVLERFADQMTVPPGSMEDLAFEMEFEFEAAIQHVHENIGFEPYKGVLRGPEGTQQAGSGNSWDQALLLAGLLNAMGAEAQVVGGRMDPDDGRRLLERSFEEVLSRSESTPDTGRIVELAAEYDERISAPLAAQIEAWMSDAPEVSIDDETVQISTALLELLKRSGRSLDEARSVDSLIETLAADYAWVRWRVGPGDPWVDLHPAFGDQESPATEPARYFDSEVPPEVQHRASLQLFAERGRPGELERVAVMSKFERPIAQLYKNPVELGMIPLRIGEDETQSFLVPQLNGAPAPGAQAINSLGLTAPPEDAASAAGQFISTVSSTLGDALGAVDSAGSPDGEGRVPRVHGLIFVLDIIAPGGETRTVERRVVDLRDWSDATFPQDAAFGMVLEFDVGPEPQELLVHQAVNQHKDVLRAMPSMLAVARDQLSYDEGRRLPEQRALNGDRWLDFDLYANAFLPPPSAERLVYRPGPLIAARRTFTDASAGTMTVTDIFHNPSRSLIRADQGEIRLDPSDSLRQGVRETLLESSLAVANGQWSSRAPSSLVTSKSELERNEIAGAWPEAALEAARMDLDAGYLLATTNDPKPHWWRIDPGNGETLGMGTFGGQEIAEYIVMVGGAAMSTYFFYRSVEDCDATYADNQQMADCCIVGNLLVTYANSAAGSATGGLPTGPSAAWAANPWLAGIGYFTASMQIELANNMVTGAVTARPIEYVCREYVID